MPDFVVDKPSNIQVSGVSSTSLRVTWDDADTSTQMSAAAAVTYYRVFYYDVNDLTSAEMDVTVEQRQAVLMDLCQFCEYNIRVAAYGLDGTSHSADAVIGRTLSDGQLCFFSVNYCHSHQHQYISMYRLTITHAQKDTSHCISVLLSFQ